GRRRRLRPLPVAPWLAHRPPGGPRRASAGRLRAIHRRRRRSRRGTPRGHPLEHVQPGGVGRGLAPAHACVRGSLRVSDLPSEASVLVIGAGIVGNSVAYHLARLGWKDIVQVDKGPLPNPGGSTGHASNFIFLVDHSKEMTALTLESVRQYKELGVFTESGGVEVARTQERMDELKRRMASARSWDRTRRAGDAGRGQEAGAVHRRGR